MRDLIALVADVDIEFALSGLLERSRAMSTRTIDFEMRRHPRRDAGCRTEAVEYLRDLSRQFRCALVVFDRDGCGVESEAPDAIEARLERELATSGWAGRCAVICIAPELEAWVWSPSPHVGRQLGFESTDALRNWLVERKLWRPEAFKPSQPKEALHAALRHSGLPASASRFEDSARSVSLSGCEDRASARFVATLSTWFPPPS